MIWALDDQVAARASVGRAARESSSEVAAVLRAVQRRARAGHRGRGPQRRVRRERAGVRRRAARPHRARGHRRRRQRRRCSSTCCPARSATCSRTRSAPSTASRAGTGRSRWRCRPSAAGSRAAAPASSRRATGRSRTSSPASTSCSPTARRSRTGGAPRAAVGPDLTQLFVGSEGTLGVIVGARLRLHPVPPAESRGPRSRSRRSPTGSTRCAGSCSAARRPRCCASTTTIEGDRSYQTGDAHVLLVLDEGDAHIVEATHARSSTRSARRATTARRRARRAVARAPQRRVGARGVDPARLRRRHDGDRGHRGARCPTIYERATAAIRAVEHTIVASAHQSHSYPDGACLYFTFAGQPPDGRARGVLPRRVGRRAARGARRRRRAQPPPRRRAQPRPVRRRRARRRRSACSQSVKDALDPNGILNPGKLGLPSPFGEVAWP